MQVVSWRFQALRNIAVQYDGVINRTMSNAKVPLWEKYCKSILTMEFFPTILEKETTFEFCYNEQGTSSGKTKSSFKSITLTSTRLSWSSLELKICHICMSLKEKKRLKPSENLYHENRGYYLRRDLGTRSHGLQRQKVCGFIKGFLEKPGANCHCSKRQYSFLPILDMSQKQHFSCKIKIRDLFKRCSSYSTNFFSAVLIKMVTFYFQGIQIKLHRYLSTFSMF